jgi:XTP/dITP diphosphohydrolase
LKDIHQEHRAASFVCTIAFVTDSEELSFTGVWSGSVATEERGTNGHGYDPVFIPEGFDVTAAELDPEVKNALSHRSIAVSALMDYLRTTSS